jgi:hypothetical protein
MCSVIAGIVLAIHEVLFDQLTDAPAPTAWRDRYD